MGLSLSLPQASTIAEAATAVISPEIPIKLRIVASWPWREP
jgi:hypothetical protein